MLYMRSPGLGNLINGCLYPLINILVGGSHVAVPVGFTPLVSVKASAQIETHSIHYDTRGIFPTISWGIEWGSTIYSRGNLGTCGF